MDRIKNGIAQVRRLAALVRGMPFLPVLLSMGLNFILALFNGIVCLFTPSFWHLTLFAYYLLLGGMRLYASAARRLGIRDRTMLRTVGIGTILLSFILCGMMILTIREGIHPAKDKVVMIFTAAATFVLAGITFRNIVRAHRQHEARWIALRNISFAGSVASFLSLERSMTGTFGRAENSPPVALEAWVGAAAFVLLLCTGVSMLLPRPKAEK